MRKLFILFSVLVMLFASVLPVFAVSFTPASAIGPAGNNAYTPTTSDFVILTAGSYYEVSVDVNNTPLTYADILNGSEAIFYGKLRNAGTAGYVLYYGLAETDSLVKIHEDNTQIGSNSSDLANSWTLDSAALSNVTEVSGGRFYIKNYGSGRGQFCFTLDLASPAGPVPDLSSDAQVFGTAGRFFRLSDADYNSILAGSSAVVCLSDAACSLIYTNSTTDNLGSFELVANLSPGAFVLSTDNAPSVTLTGGYLAVYFLSDCSFTYRVRSVNITPVNISVDGFSRFALSPFYNGFSSYNPSSNFLQFSMLSILVFGVVWYIIKYFK